jgi:hypothetical protein
MWIVVGGCYLAAVLVVLGNSMFKVLQCSVY